MKLLCTLCMLLSSLSCFAQLSAEVQGKSVKLTWVGSVSKNVDHYKLYRSKKAGGSYTTRIDSIGKTKRTVVDFFKITSGTTYYYVMTTFDTAGVESGPSNEAVATIP